MSETSESIQNQDRSFFNNAKSPIAFSAKNALKSLFKRRKNSPTVPVVDDKTTSLPSAGSAVTELEGKENLAEANNVSSADTLETIPEYQTILPNVVITPAPEDLSDVLQSSQAATSSSSSPTLVMSAAAGPVPMTLEAALEAAHVSAPKN